MASLTQNGCCGSAGVCPPCRCAITRIHSSPQVVTSSSGCGQRLQYSPQNLQIRHHVGGARRSGADMHRPCASWCALEEIFISAIVTSCKNEIRLGKISE